MKGGFNTCNLFYQSIWFLNKDQFGAARLTREVVDHWLAGKLEFAGQKIGLNPPELSPDEVASVPGGTACANSLDTVSFEVLERSGGKMLIKSDENKLWLSQGGTITEDYKALHAKHMELIGSGIDVVESPQAPAETGGGGEGETTAGPTSPPCEEKESLEKLQESPGVEVKVASEISGVDLVLAKDSSLWLVASTDKVVAKNSQLGGFGTGQYVPAEEEQGLDFLLPLGDKSLVQLDESSWKTDGSGTSVVTFYKLLVMCERDKNITDHKVSYMTVSRKAQTNLEQGMDGFDIQYKNKMRFKCLPQDRLTWKNIFSKVVSQAAGYQQILPVFRFRFERIGGTLKLQKPHMITKNSLQLKANKPLKIQ